MDYKSNACSDVGDTSPDIAESGHPKLHKLNLDSFLYLKTLIFGILLGTNIFETNNIWTNIWKYNAGTEKGDVYSLIEHLRHPNLRNSSFSFRKTMNQKI